MRGGGGARLPSRGARSEPRGEGMRSCTPASPGPGAAGSCAVPPTIAHAGCSCHARCGDAPSDEDDVSVPIDAPLHWTARMNHAAGAHEIDHDDIDGTRFNHLSERSDAV